MTFLSPSSPHPAAQARRSSLLAGSVLALAGSAQASLIEPANGVLQPSVTLNTSFAITGQTVLGQLTLSLPATSSNGQAVIVNQPFLLTLNSNYELTLWNFVTTIRAQQSGQPLLFAQGSMGNIEYTFNALNNISPPSNSVVPLPAAGWLFVSGLAGMGALMRKRRAKTRLAGERPPAGARAS